MNASALTGVSWSVWNATVLHFTYNCLWQSARHRYRIYAFSEAIYGLNKYKTKQSIAVIAKISNWIWKTYLFVAIYTPNCLPDSLQRSVHRNCYSYNRKHCLCCSSFVETPRNYRIHHIRIARTTASMSPRILHFRNNARIKMKKKNNYLDHRAH